MSLVSRLVRVARFALLLPVFVSGAGFAADAVPPRANGISVSVSIVRTDGATGKFLCTAEITDLASGEVISAPKVAFTSESSAEMKTGSQAGPNKPPSEVLMQVSASKAGDSASYTVSYTREGVLVAVQKGSLSLR